MATPDRCRRWIRQPTCAWTGTCGRRTRTNIPWVSIARSVRRVSVAVAYVREDGADFIGWTDVAGQYRADTRPLPDGRVVPVMALDVAVTPTGARRFLLTNQADYALTYNGLVMVAEKHRSHGWQAFGSYTLSRSSGLQPSSGTMAAGAQVSTVAPPPAPQGVTFGRDPNDLTQRARSSSQ